MTKLLSKTLLIRPQYTEHTFENNKCAFCLKTKEQLFWELIWQYEDEMALEYLYRVQSLGHFFSEAEYNHIVHLKHKWCLTPDEITIRDIIL